MGKLQRARNARKAAAAAELRLQQQRQHILDNLPPPRPWTRGRIAYTALLWLLWSASLAWPFALGWYAADAPHALLLEAPPYDRDLALAPRLGYGLSIALSLRLLFDNFELSSVPVVMGAVFCFVAMELAPGNIEGADRIGWRYLGTERVAVSSTQEHRGRSTWHETVVDNPRRRGEVLEWDVPAEKGQVLCMDVFVGQLGGLWARAPKPCQ